MPSRKKSETKIQTETGTEATAEQVQRIPISNIHPFEGYPLKVLDEDSMAEAVESTKQFGGANSHIVHPDPKDGNEIISGHKRYHAVDGMGCQEETAPTLVSTKHN